MVEQTFRWKLLRTVAYSSRIEKKTLMILHNNPDYTRKCIRLLAEKKIIKESKDAAKEITLTSQGLDFVKEKDPRAYDFYEMCFAKDGRTSKHKALCRKIGVATAMFGLINCPVGSEKMSLAELRENQMHLPWGTVSFYSMREMKEEHRRESRTRSSRATGILFAPNTTSLVYVCSSETMLMSRMCELEAIELLKQSMYSIYGHVEDIRRALLLVPDEATAVKLIRNTETKNSIGTLISSTGNKSLRVTFHYVPVSRFGCVSLLRLMYFTSEQFKAMCFQQDERAAAKSLGMGDAIIKDLVCYEFVSSDVSKLSQVLARHKDSMDKVGIVCDVEQVSFIRCFFSEYPHIKIRALETKKINSYFFGREELL